MKEMEKAILYKPTYFTQGTNWFGPYKYTIEQGTNRYQLPNSLVIHSFTDVKP
jgi:hypothetical protein